MKRTWRNGLWRAFLLAALATGGPSGAAQPRGATPLGNPGEWVTTEDYPSSALIDDSQGIVTFRLKIDAQGRPFGCEIIQSSGSDQLDAATCNLISQRARFSPARDARNRPVEGTYTNRVRWVLPKELPQPKPAEMEMTFIVEADGSISDCEVVKAVGIKEQERLRMEGSCRDRSTTPFVDDAGQPVRRLVTIKASTQIAPAP